MVIKTFYSLSQAENPQILKHKRIREKNKTLTKYILDEGYLKATQPRLTHVTLVLLLRALLEHHSGCK